MFYSHTHTQKNPVTYFLTSLPCFPEEPPKKKKKLFPASTYRRGSCVAKVKNRLAKKKRGVIFTTVSF